MPREGAFFNAVVTQMQKDEEPVIVKRAATPAEIASMFGIPMG